jgi:hypothetical protein
VVGEGVEGSCKGMAKIDIMLSMFAEKMKSHLMLISGAYEVMYVVM